MYKLLGKEVRGRFAFPSGEIATNSDTARWMVENIPQIGAVIGKSTTIDGKAGNKEDICLQISPDSLWNAVGFTNPGLEATIEGFQELRALGHDDIFLMPQIGEDTPEKFGYCVERFEKAGCADGYEANISCGHASTGGINLSDVEKVRAIFAAMREKTKKPLVGKLNASVPELEKLVAAIEESGKGGIVGISFINTVPGPYPEISNKFGGYSGKPIFPVLLRTLKELRPKTKAQFMVMGGISGADDIRQLEKVDDNLFYEIGTILSEMSSSDTKIYFDMLDYDLSTNFTSNNEAEKFALIGKKAHQYKPFIVREAVQLSNNLKLIRFYEDLEAGAGQFVFLKVGDSRTAGKENDEFAKPFSVADHGDGLELVIKKVGPATSKIFQLKENNAVRIRGPYGNEFNLPDDQTVVYLGAGCGIAPVHHAAKHHNGRNVFVLGARTSAELVYLDDFRKMGEVKVATDDGTLGYHGYVTDLLQRVLEQAGQRQLDGAVFFNCGPEHPVMKQADKIEREYTNPERIYHLVERMTSCGNGICSKCSIPYDPATKKGGKKACVDGPVFTAEEFTPGIYTRDKTGAKVYFNL